MTYLRKNGREVKKSVGISLFSFFFNTQIWGSLLATISRSKTFGSNIKIDIFSSHTAGQYMAVGPNVLYWL